MAASRRIFKSNKFRRTLTHLIPDRKERKAFIAALDNVANTAEQGICFPMSGEIEDTCFRVVTGFVVGYRFDTRRIKFRLIVRKDAYVA